jgi:hypothetical protein
MPSLSFVIASVAKQSRVVCATLDCFAALAMTKLVCLEDTHVH